MQKTRGPPIWRLVESLPAVRASAVLAAQREDPMRTRNANAVLFLLASAFALAVGFTPAAVGNSTRARTDAISPNSSSGFKSVANADAYVSAAKPSANYGSSNRLKSEASPIIDSYIRFDGGKIG